MNLLHSSLLNSAQCPFVMHSSSLLYFEAFSSILFFAVLSILFCTILFSSPRGYLLQPILFKLVLIYVFSCQSHQVCSKSISRFVNEIRLKHIKPFSWWNRLGSERAGGEGLGEPWPGQAAAPLAGH